MPTRKDAEPVRRRRLWTGRILSVVAVLFLPFDIVIKLLQIAPVTESFERLGYPPDIAFGLGLLELACLVLYGRASPEGGATAGAGASAVRFDSVRES